MSSAGTSCPAWTSSNSIPFIYNNPSQYGPLQSDIQDNVIKDSSAVVSFHWNGPNSSETINAGEKRAGQAAFTLQKYILRYIKLNFPAGFVFLFLTDIGTFFLMLVTENFNISDWKLDSCPGNGSVLCHHVQQLLLLEQHLPDQRTHNIMKKNYPSHCYFRSTSKWNELAVNSCTINLWS